MHTARLIRLKLTLFIFFTCFFSKSFAVMTAGTVPAVDLASKQTPPLSILHLIENPKHIKGIKLIDNRFRIDHYVDEIVMIFFRKQGSSPVILIRPDGSKLYAPTMPPAEGEWYDDYSYDMIRLKNPMVGPWQAVGKIEENSKIMVISNIELQVDPLPELLFSGETIKLNARLTNNGELIDYGNFSDVVSLDVTFTSTNNNQYENFGADTVNVARFKDDGQGFDEKRKDSVFTGEFKLELIPGEWLASFFLDLGLFNREITFDPIVLEKNPFIFDVDKAVEDGQQHLFKISSESDLIDFKSFVFSGDIYYPNGETEKFAISASEDDVKTMELFNYSDGIYKIKVSAFGKNKLGRDMMMSIPEYEFNIAPAVSTLPEELIDLEQSLAETLPKEPEVVVVPEPEPTPAWQVISIILGIFIFICLIAFLLFKFVIFNDKPLFKDFSIKNLMRKKAPAKEMELPDNEHVDKLSTDNDDIIDLSLPDET